jgi:hypothetical protein
VDWKRIWATRDNAREGAVVGIRAASFGTWLTANDQGAVVQWEQHGTTSIQYSIHFNTDDTEVCKSSFGVILDIVRIWLHLSINYTYPRVVQTPYLEK